MSGRLEQDREAIETYDRIADRFDEHARSSAHNAHYERPAMVALLHDVRDLRVLDAGCGSGAYSETLIEAGARVVAVDASARMVALTREKVGDGVPVHQHDLREPLEFLDGESFDVVLCLLVLDYVARLTPVFAEFHRVLKPNGAFVFSMSHPFSDFGKRGTEYLQIEPVVAWFPNLETEMPSFRRPLSDIHSSLRASGFVLEDLVEPLPTEECAREHPETYKKLRSQPIFICLRARKSSMG